MKILHFVIVLFFNFGIAFTVLNLIYIRLNILTIKIWMGTYQRQKQLWCRRGSVCCAAVVQLWRISCAIGTCCISDRGMGGVSDSQTEVVAGADVNDCRYTWFSLALEHFPWSGRTNWWRGWHSVRFFCKSGRKVRRQEDMPLYHNVWISGQGAEMEWPKIPSPACINTMLCRN